MYLGFCIGERLEYDEKGNIIKTTNYDKDYPFSIYDLATKIKNEYHIDILRRSPKLTVIRGYDSGYYYEVGISLGESIKNNAKVIRIDGTNGTTISTKMVPYTK